MRRYHWLVGVLMVVIFLITGQLMHRHEPPMGALSDSIRLMFRSRHIYLLASGLVNLMLGLYMRREAAGWRVIVQNIGSGLLIASPVLLILAFLIEPERGFRAEMWWSAAGLYTLFAGCMAHLASASGKPRREPKQATARSASG
jgi:hypothetical protein